MTLLSDLYAGGGYPSTGEQAFLDADHTKLDGIENSATVDNISDANVTDLTDSGETSLHKHALESMVETIQASSDTLTTAEVTGRIISNYGQGAANNLQTLPVAAEGMSLVGICGTAQASNYFRFQANTNDKIYLDGTAGSDNGYVSIAAPVVGAMIVLFTFQTGAGVYDWTATTISGTWITA